METLNPVDYQHAHGLPLTQTSHLRESRLKSPTVQAPQSATRMAHSTDMQQQSQPILSAPASQESIVSDRSDASSAARILFGSNSDLSSYATNDTGFTSPSSSAESRTLSKIPSASFKLQRVTTPENATVKPPQDESEVCLASPMSISSPGYQNGAKRTASGHVKNAPSLPNNFLIDSLVPHSPRRQSVSSPGSKGGELAQSLRSRLEYAMAKVQHGWEHKSITEVEQLAARKVLGHRHSVSNGERPSTSSLSNGTSQLSIFSSPRIVVNHDHYASPPSKRRSGIYGLASSPYTATSPPLNGLPHLQPAADIRTTTASTNRQFHSRTSPNNHHTLSNTYSTHTRSSNHNSMSPPRTPVATTTSNSAKSKPHLSPRTHRPPTLRTQTQTAEAERDALQALYELGSPRTSSQLSSSTRHPASGADANSGQASPWHATSQQDLMSSTSSTPRRVTFSRSGSDAESTEGATKLESGECGRDDAALIAERGS